jgi:UDP-N-acetylmuramate: L-alanyl-gamma-D-glutamyl-meso-diaminopimelate ligase
MPELEKSVVKAGFQKNDLQVFNKRQELEQWLDELNYNNSVVLLMSSGNYEGINTNEIAEKITGLAG